MDIHQVAVLGTGMMGPGIACVTALGGATTTIVGRNTDGAERGVKSAHRLLETLAEQGLVDPARARAAGAHIRSTSDLPSGVKDADVVIESVPEDLELKQQLFFELEQMVRPDTILTTNTSGLSVTQVASRCERPERVITTHFWNPPHLMPLVELVCGQHSSVEVAETVKQFLLRSGKVPVIVKKDRPGQLGNRMQMALVREAVNIVQEGIASAEDVDLAARLGFGLRLPAYGVLEHQDIVGLQMAFSICDYVAEDLNNDPKAPELFREKIQAGEWGAAAGKGFHDWSKKSATHVKERRDRFVTECLRLGITKDLS